MWAKSNVVWKSVEQCDPPPGRGDDGELPRRKPRDVGPVVGGGDQLVRGQGRERGALDGLERRGHVEGALDDREGGGLAGAAHDAAPDRS